MRQFSRSVAYKKSLLFCQGVTSDDALFLKTVFQLQVTGEMVLSLGWSAGTTAEPCPLQLLLLSLS